MKIHNVEQGSPEWYQLRLGIITASEIKALMADDSKARKGRNTYMNKLIAEKVTGLRQDWYTSPRLELGHEMEVKSIAEYEEVNGVTVERVGFITNHGIGYSPDGLVKDDGALECKSKDGHLHIEIVLSGEVPDEYYAQCQCGLWVSEREWLDYIQRAEGMASFIKRLYRNEGYIKRMQLEVNRFHEELEEKMNRFLVRGV